MCYALPFTMPNTDYTTDPITKVQYHFFKKHDKGSKPVLGDYADIIVVLKSPTDSVLFDSRDRPKGDTMKWMKLPLKKRFVGCIEEGITLMSINDSAKFRVPSDSLYLISLGKKTLPSFAPPGSYVTFSVRLLRFQTEDQMKAESDKLKEDQARETNTRRTSESFVIGQYVKSKYPNVKPTAVDSFYVLSKRVAPGGTAIMPGDSVEVKYKGSLLDGTVFDSTGNKNFTILYNRNAQLIRGWIEVLGTMHQGDKYKVLLPSGMAYGSQYKSALMKPYTPLIFDIEVVRVKSNNK
jgi:FKBP-type peptidyl-prolyl cis-trans isomerase